MSTIKGSSGIAKLGANTVAEVREFSLNTTAIIIESRRKGDAGPKRETDGTDFSGSVKCWWDPTDTNGQEALQEGDAVTLLLYPDTAASGKQEYSLPAIVSDVQYNSPESGLGDLSFNFVSSTAGGLTRGTVA